MLERDDGVVVVIKVVNRGGHKAVISKPKLDHDTS